VAALHAGVRAGLSEGASAPTRELLAQGRDGFFLGPHHRHGADLKPLGRTPQRQALQDSEPQGCGLGGRQLIDQLLQRHAMDGLTDGRLGFWSGQLIEQAGLAISAGIKAEVPQRALPLLVQPAWHPHQPHAIADVVLQGPSDAAAQIGRSGLTSSAAGSGANQGLAGDLDQILPLHQPEQAPGGCGSDDRGILPNPGLLQQHSKQNQRSSSGRQSSTCRRLRPNNRRATIHPVFDQPTA
jgi:hypothetical protein